MMTLYKNDPEVICFENEGEGGDGGAEAAAAAATAAAAAAATAAASADEKTFNQAQVNEIVGKRNKALQEQFGALEGSYKELLTQTNLTKEGRLDLEAKLERVQTEMMDEKQKLEHQNKKAEEKYTTDLKAANEQRKYYQDLYETSTIERSIIDAAEANGAWNGNQFIAELGPRSKVVEETDTAGNSTGRLVPKVEWMITNEETKEQTLVLRSPAEVIALMKEEEVHGNLFKANVAAGVGSGTNTGPGSSSGAVNHKRISTEEYMKLRSTPEGRKRLGLS